MFLFVFVAFGSECSFIIAKSLKLLFYFHATIPEITIQNMQCNMNIVDIPDKFCGKVCHEKLSFELLGCSCEM